MTLLPRPWQLHDVDDVERLLARAIARSSFAGDLSFDEHDDLLAALLAVAWQLADTFDPARGRFATYLYGSAQRRAVDWLRTTRGRTKWSFAGHTHERSLPVFVPLDAAGGGELEGSLAGGMLDGVGDRDPALERLLRARARAPAGYDGRVGASSASRAG